MDLGVYKWMHLNGAEEEASVSHLQYFSNGIFFVLLFRYFNKEILKIAILSLFFIMSS